MPDFECTVCGESFSVPEEALQRYPGWQPKYCRKHSPKKQTAQKGRPSRGKAAAAASITADCDLTPAEVLQRFSAGPQSGIFTDGSARPNPGPGGWGAALVKDGALVREMHGQAEQTTNNRMELTALIEGVQMAPPHQPLVVYTDSELCVNIINRWAAAWEQRGWKRKTGAVENLDLVKPLYELFCERPNLKLEWIKAHNGWLWNEYANALAGERWGKESD